MMENNINADEVYYKIPTGEVLSFTEYLIWISKELVKIKKNINQGNDNILSN